MRRSSPPTARVSSRLALLVISTLLALPTVGLAGAAWTTAAPGTLPAVVHRHAEVPIGAREPMSLRSPVPLNRPAASGVNPFAIFNSEPAPMGLTDFGVRPDGSGYSYSTSEFVGTARFHNYTSYSSAQRTSESGLQLNVVLYFTSGGTTFAYWIQDVLFVGTSTNNVQFLDNIWNLTTGSGLGLYSNSVSGNGSCGCSTTTPGIYIAVAGSQPGNNVNLTSPYTIQLRTIAAVVGGTPRVYFDYNDGFGWQTFDTTVFSFTASVASAAFRVDGTQYILGGLFDDAELVLGGPGGGSSSSVTGGGVDLTLEYDNGHNLQVVPNSYNFGSDTAETMSKVSIAYADAANGSLPAAAVSSGSGKPAELYNASSYSTLTVLMPSAGSGTLTVNGAAVPFRGGRSVLSLAPGPYDLVLLGAGYAGATNVTLTAGTPLTVTLPLATFAVDFHQTGLAPGTGWGVHLGGLHPTTTGSWLNFTELNGSYPYSVDPVPGYVTPPHAPALAVAGVTQRVDLRFWPFNFSVVFEASNLPTGTMWSVAVGGQTISGSGADLVFALPNGTYGYSVGVANAYEPQPSLGNVSVPGASTLVTIAFSLRPGYVVGVVRPSNATVLLDGQPVAVTGGFFNVSEIPGTFSLEALAPGYTPQFQNVTLTPGNESSIEFLLAAAPGSPSDGSHPTGSTGSTLSGGTWLLAALAVVAVAGAVAGLGYLRRGGRRP